MDYFIVSTDFFNIAEFEVGDRSESVHFPSHCTLDFKCKIERSENDNEHNYVSNEDLYKQRWDEHKKNMFFTNFGNIFFWFEKQITYNYRPKY